MTVWENPAPKIEVVRSQDEVSGYQLGLVMNKAQEFGRYNWSKIRAVAKRETGGNRLRTEIELIVWGLDGQQRPELAQEFTDDGLNDAIAYAKQLVRDGLAMSVRIRGVASRPYAQRGFGDRAVLNLAEVRLPETEHLHVNMHGGRAEGRSPSEFDPHALALGAQHELEHTDDPRLAQEIAMDHLAEDEAYYEKLNAMERQSFRNNPEMPVGSVNHFSLILTGLLTQYDQAEIKREEKRGRGNYYRLGLLFEAAQSAYDETLAKDPSYGARSDAEALTAYRHSLMQNFIYEAPSRRAEPEFALSPLRKLDKAMQAWVTTGQRPKYPVAPPEQTPNGGHYVWVLDAHGAPLTREGILGPYDLQTAKTFARIAATEGKHDRAVSLGRDPQTPSFQIARRYRAGTGERVI